MSECLHYIFWECLHILLRLINIEMFLDVSTKEEKTSPTLLLSKYGEHGLFKKLKINWHGTIVCVCADTDTVCLPLFGEYYLRIMFCLEMVWTLLKLCRWGGWIVHALPIVSFCKNVLGSPVYLQFVHWIPHAIVSTSSTRQIKYIWVGWTV